MLFRSISISRGVSVFPVCRITLRRLVRSREIVKAVSQMYLLKTSKKNNGSLWDIHKCKPIHKTLMPFAPTNLLRDGLKISSVDPNLNDLGLSVILHCICYALGNDMVFTQVVRLTNLNSLRNQTKVKLTAIIKVLCNSYKSRQR